MPTFTWLPEYGADVEIKPKVNRAVFGDGYEQRVRDGINTKARTWNLTFMKSASDIDLIDSFLSNEAGAGSFDWIPPRGATGKWVCDTWKRGISNPGYETITTTFREVFGE